MNSDFAEYPIIIKLAFAGLYATPLFLLLVLAYLSHLSSIGRKQFLVLQNIRELLELEYYNAHPEERPQPVAAKGRRRVKV